MIVLFVIFLTITTGTNSCLGYWQVSIMYNSTEAKPPPKRSLTLIVLLQTGCPANAKVYLIHLSNGMLWSAICKIIPWAKVNSICHMSIFIHVASKKVYAMPKSIYNVGNCICHFIYVECNFMCDICCMFIGQNCMQYTQP